MKISKITDNNYTFYQEGDDYNLLLGAIKKGEDTTTELLFEEVENINKLSVSSTCGCTSTDRKVIDDHTISVKIKYKDCDATFSKVLNCNDNGKAFKIRVKGTCKN
jgi:hypothetical protein